MMRLCLKSMVVVEELLDALVLARSRYLLWIYLVFLLSPSVPSALRELAPHLFSGRSLVFLCDISGISRSPQSIRIP